MEVLYLLDQIGLKRLHEVVGQLLFQELLREGARKIREKRQFREDQEELNREEDSKQ